MGSLSLEPFARVETFDPELSNLLLAGRLSETARTVLERRSTQLKKGEF